MNTQLVNGHGLATVTDLLTRPVGRAPWAVSVRAHPHRSGLWTVVEVEGEMDVQIVALAADLLIGDTTCVVFDLHGVTFMDASGLSLMLQAQRTAHTAGGSAFLVAPSRSVRRLLALTGCDRVFRTFDSLDEAMSAPVDTGPEPAC